MKRARLAALAACALMLPPPVAVSAPRAASSEECEFFWDIAITARGLALEGLPLEYSRGVIWRIFDTQGNARASEIANAVIDAAHARPAAEGERAGTFAQQLKRQCYEGAGDLDPVLGVSL